MFPHCICSTSTLLLAFQDPLVKSVLITTDIRTSILQGIIIINFTFDDVATDEQGNQKKSQSSIVAHNEAQHFEAN